MHDDMTLVVPWPDADVTPNWYFHLGLMRDSMPCQQSISQGLAEWGMELIMELIPELKSP